jgi:hypothetical protein
MLFSQLDWFMSFCEEDHSGKVTFLSQNFKCTYCLHDLKVLME